MTAWCYHNMVGVYTVATFIVQCESVYLHKWFHLQASRHLDQVPQLVIGQYRHNEQARVRTIQPRLVDLPRHQ